MSDQHIRELSLDGGKTVFIQSKTGSWISSDKQNLNSFRNILSNLYSLDLDGLSNDELLLAHKIVESKVIYSDRASRSSAAEHDRVKLVIIEPSQFCSLACTYCFEDNPVRGNKMTLETADYVVDEVLKLPLSEKPIIEFNGGESLLNWDAIERIICGLNRKIATEIRTSKPTYTIQTSGTVFPQRAIKFLSDNAISIGISLDGPQEVQDSRRPLANGKGSYNKIVENLSRLNEAGVSFGLLAIIETAQQLSQAYHHLRGLNPKSIRINLQRKNGRSKHHISDNELRKIADEHFRCFVDDLDRMKCGESPMRLADICSLIENICLEIKPYMCQKSPCGAGTEQITFDWKGNVWACQEFIGEDRFLVFDRESKEGINPSDNLNAVQKCAASDSQSLFSERSVDKILGCNSCLFKHYCQSGCSATAWYSVTDEKSRSMNVKTPHCQYYYRIIPKLFDVIVNRTDEVYEYVFSRSRGYGPTSGVGSII